MIRRCVRSTVLATLVGLIAAASGGCGGGSGDKPSDASADSPGDSACGANVFFTGEIVDWDSTETTFCGVFGSTVTVRGQPAQTDSSSPNGRFGVCMVPAAETLVDVTHSASASPCVTGSYPVPAVFVAEQAVINAGGLFSARAMTQDRMNTMFNVDNMINPIGQTYDASRGQLVVHVVGTQRAVSISTADHAAVQQFDGASWKPSTGSTGLGTDVLFPNVVAGTAIQVSVAAGAIGTTSLTLEAGKFTYLTVVAN